MSVADEGTIGRDDCATAKLRFLNEKLKEAQYDFEGRAYGNTDSAFRLRIAIVSVGCMVTFLVALRGVGGLADFEPHLAVVTLLFSSSVPILTAVESFKDYRWRWLHDDLTAKSFAKIRFDLEFAAAGACVIDEGKLDEFYAQMSAVFAEANRGRLERHSEKPKN